MKKITIHTETGLQSIYINPNNIETIYDDSATQLIKITMVSGQILYVDDIEELVR